MTVFELRLKYGDRPGTTLILPWAEYNEVIKSMREAGIPGETLYGKRLAVKYGA